MYLIYKRLGPTSNTFYTIYNYIDQNLIDSPSPNAAKFRKRHLQNNKSCWLCTQQTQ